MPDYKAGSITGSTWTRCKYIAIKNLRNEVPKATFLEEKCINIGDDIVAKDIGELNAVFTPDVINESFKILDADGNDTGTTMTYGQLYCVLKSVYMHNAIKRDNAIISQGSNQS